MEQWNKESLETGIKTGITLVDFWAPWCSPCRALTGVLESVSQKMEGKIRFAKVNVDENEDLATQFSVANIPTLLIFKEGALVDRTMGYMDEEELTGFIEKNLE